MATVSDIGQLISIDPEFRDGRPCIAGTGISVRRLIGWYKQGYSPEEIADDYDLSLAQVHAAITYYHANSDQMESEMQAEEEEERRLYAEHQRQRKERP